MLLNPQTAHNKMFSIALDCGFNSESVFYTNFKKLTGFTPRQFQKEHEVFKDDELDKTL